MGTGIVPYTFHERSIGNRKFLHELCIETGLIATNTIFDKSPRNLWTHISDISAKKSQIDFILMNQKWPSSAHNCEA